jgi:hypothetical protein
VPRRPAADRGGPAPVRAQHRQPFRREQSAWSRFVDREIIPRFPDGLTIFDATGRWQDRAANRIAREPSKIVEIALPGTSEDIVRLNEIVEAYKSRFKQQSVGLIVRPACVSF